MTWTVGGHFLGGERRASRHGAQENLLGDYMDLLVRSKPLVRETSPFTHKTARRGVLWLEPELVVEISYAEVVRGLEPVEGAGRRMSFR